MNNQPGLSAVTAQRRAIRLETLKITFADKSLLTGTDQALQQQDYLQNEQNESVDQGNFQYHFRGICLIKVKLELDDTSTNSNSDRLRTVIGAEFLHDVFYVDLDRFF